MGRITNRSAFTIPGFSFGFVIAVLFGLKRDLVNDARRVSRRLKPVYEGLENIPATGPLVIISNHYGDKDVHIFWGMFAISNALIGQRDKDLPRGERVPAWLVQNQWPRREGDVKRPDPLTRWVFGRVINMYDFVPHDPLPENTSARAGALHTLVARATGRGAGQDGKPTPIGIFPEGMTNTEGHQLLLPPAGAGTMLGLLSRSNIPLLPVAIHEEGGQYIVRFGPTFALDRGSGDRDKAARDEGWSRQAMNHIAEMMPPQLRGPYALLPAPSESGEEK